MHPPSKRILIQHLSNWHRNTPNPSRLLFISSKVHEIFKYSLQFFKNPSSKFSKNLWKIIFQVYEIFKYSFKLLKNASTFSQIHYISFKSWNILFKSSKFYDIFKYSLKFLKKSIKFLLKFWKILWKSSQFYEIFKYSLKFLKKSRKNLKIPLKIRKNPENSLKIYDSWFNSMKYWNILSKSSRNLENPPKILKKFTKFLWKSTKILNFEM